MLAENNLDFACDWRFAFNLRAREKGTVGYLLFWSGCGGLNLTKDITIWNPFDGAGQTVVRGPTVDCIGVIEKFAFAGGENDPIRIGCYVSKATAANVRAKLARPLTNTKLKVAWYVIDFDGDKKVWYEAAFIKSPGKADSNIDSAGGELQIFIDNEPTRISETLDLSVFKFEFQLVPAEGGNNLLEFATGPQTRLVKKWGD